MELLTRRHRILKGCASTIVVQQALAKVTLANDRNR
jgi:hypothetical protein